VKTRFLCILRIFGTWHFYHLTFQLINLEEPTTQWANKNFIFGTSTIHKNILKNHKREKNLTYAHQKRIKQFCFFIPIPHQCLWFLLEMSWEKICTKNYDLFKFGSICLSRLKKFQAARLSWVLNLFYWLINLLYKKAIS
jgi:hypothetical protein